MNLCKFFARQRWRPNLSRMAYFCSYDMNIGPLPLGLRVVNLWNLLLQTVVEAKSTGVFKAEIDRFLISKGVKGHREWSCGKDS